MRLPNWLSQSLSPIMPYTPYLVRGTHMGLCTIAPVFLFLCFFNPNVLDPTRIGWLLEADWGQHVLGWNAFRHAADGFNHESLLGAPMGNPIIGTDSNPLFAFIFRPFSGLLPEHFQYIGLWFFVCVVLHFIFAYKLIRPHAPGRWSAFGGALALSALPMLYYRMRHDTLMAQWLVLWGLHLFINVPADGGRVFTAKSTAGHDVALAAARTVLASKTFGYALLLGLCGLIHPYILFMVAAIWGGDVLRAFWPAARALDRRALWDVTWKAAVVLASPLATLGISGSYQKGMSSGAGGYGYYSYPLDGWFNPVRSEFSAILKAWSLNGGQSFEGYQYLGFGLLVLVGLAAILYIATPEARRSRDFLLGLRPLILPFLALFLIAISNHAMIYGYTLWNFAMPDILKGPAAVLRASGRLVWPITYLLIVAALVVLFKSRPRIVAIVLPAILLVQGYDLYGFASNMRAATALSASTETYYLTPSPVWDRLVAASTGVDFYPANVHLNDKLFYELTWRATSRALPVNTMYAARENIIQLAYEDKGQDDFKEGMVNANHLFVFLKQCDAPQSLWPRLRMLDGVWIIPPAGAGDLDLARPQWTPLANKLRFGWLDQGTCLLDENWSKPDTEGVWSDGPKAGIVIPIRHVRFDTPKPRALDLNLQARSRTPVVVTVVVNGVKVTRIHLDRRKSDNVIHLPSWALRSDSLNIRFLVAGQADDTSPVLPLPVAVTGRGATAASQMAAAQVATAALGIKLMNMTLVDPDTPPLKGPAGA